jgi:hypothetical protein
MSRPVITTKNHRTNSGSTRAGQTPVERDLTYIYVDGEHVDTIMWNRPLLRRLEQGGLTREEYVAAQAARWSGHA